MPEGDRNQLPVNTARSQVRPTFGSLHLIQVTAATTTFDPSEDRSDAEKAAEAAALEQGEKIAQMQEEDRARRLQQSEDEQEDAALIGGKFKSQDDLLKAYEELQRKMSSGEKNPPKR